MEGMRNDAIEKRRMAELARRLAELMHQPDVRKELTRQSRILDQLAGDLEELVRQRSAGIGVIANDP